MSYFTLLSEKFCYYFFVFHIGDRLLVIGGRGLNYKFLSDVELVTPSSNNDQCDPTDLNEEVYAHASVVSREGNIVTCGGYNKNWNPSSKCQIETSTGETRFFSSMNYKRYWFGMSIINGIIYAIGGYSSSYNKMESINIKTENHWKVEANMPFEVWSHCVVTINTKIVVIGGRNGGTSKLVSEDNILPIFNVLKL